MGQLHQILVIGKAKLADKEKAEYLCLAAVSHSCLYGNTALFSAFRFLSLCRNPHNARLIKHELDSFAGKTFEEIKNSKYRAAFVFSMLHMAVGIPLDEPLEGGLKTLIHNEYGCSPAGGIDPGKFLGYWPNDEGFTVFDVTQPLYPRYAFVSSGHIDGNKAQLPPFIPCNAQQYIRCYYAAQGQEQEQGKRQEEEGEDEKKKAEINRLLEEEIHRRVSTIDGMGCELIRLEAMAETWPEQTGFTKALEERDQNQEGATSMGRQVGKGTLLPTLNTSSLKRIVNHALENDDPTVFETEEAQNLLRISNDSIGILRECIKTRKLANNGSLGVITTLLDLELRLAKGYEMLAVDVSHFPFLQGDQVIEIAKRLSSSSSSQLNGNPSFPSFRPQPRILDVSHLKKISPQQVLLAWKSLPSISHIVAFDCPLITPSSVNDLVRLKEAKTSPSFVQHVNSFQINFSQDDPELKSRLKAVNKVFPRSFVFAIKKPTSGSFSTARSIFGAERDWIGSSHQFFPGAINILRNLNTWVEYRYNLDAMGYFEVTSFAAKVIMGNQNPRWWFNNKVVGGTTGGSEASFGFGVGRPIFNEGLYLLGSEMKQNDNDDNDEGEGAGMDCWMFLIITPPEKWHQMREMSPAGDVDESNPPKPWEPYKWGFVRRRKAQVDGGSEDIQVADVSIFLDEVVPGWRSESFRSILGGELIPILEYSIESNRG